MSYQFVYLVSAQNGLTIVPVESALHFHESPELNILCKEKRGSNAAHKKHI